MYAKTFTAIESYFRIFNIFIHYTQFKIFVNRIEFYSGSIKL